MATALIRPYRASDRDAVRRLCWETAWHGSPLLHSPVDRETFADLWTRYYTDVEPQSLWILADDDRPVGYLSGCRDEPGFLKAMRWPIAPLAVAGGLWHHRFRIAPLVGYAWRHRGLLRTGLSHEASLRQRYPAHFHINLGAGYRGQGWGQRLVEQFMAQVRDAGISGVRGATLSDNAEAAGLFNRLGFREVSRAPTWAPELSALGPAEKVVYARGL